MYFCSGNMISRDLCFSMAVRRPPWISRSIKPIFQNVVTNIKTTDHHHPPTTQYNGMNDDDWFRSDMFQFYMFICFQICECILYRPFTKKELCIISDLSVYTYSLQMHFFAFKCSKYVYLCYIVEIISTYRICIFMLNKMLLCKFFNFICHGYLTIKITIRCGAMMLLCLCFCSSHLNIWTPEPININLSNVMLSTFICCDMLNVHCVVSLIGELHLLSIKWEKLNSNINLFYMFHIQQS